MALRRATFEPIASRSFSDPCWYTRPGAAPPAGEFSPDSIAGLVLWLAADDAATLFQTSALDTPASDDGHPVGGWKNKASDAYHALQATEANRATLRLDAVNELPAIEFDGASDYLAVSRMEGQFASGLTYFFVLSFVDGRPASARTPFGARTTLPFQSYLLATLTTGGVLTHLTIIDTLLATAQFGALPDGETPFHVAAVVVEPDVAATSYFDGSEIASGSLDGTIWSHIAGPVTESPYLGAENFGGAASGHTSLRVAEVLMYGAPLSPGDRAAVEAHLLTKYGLD